MIPVANSTDTPERPIESAGQPAPRRRRLRGLVFRLAAVVVGLSPLLLLEGVLAILDLGKPTYRDDPFIGFRAVHPLFIPSADGTRYEIAPSRLAYFRPESFAAQKGPHEFRIFFLGGSTVQGSPFSTETSMSTFLESALAEADPSRRWEAINCGGISYASYRLVPILEEVLHYQPDLIVLYTGQNEFLEDRTYGHIKRLPAVLAWPAGVVLRSRTYTLLHEGYVRLRGNNRASPAERPVLEDETDAILEYQNGIDAYHRDEKWRENVIAHYEYNVRRMLHMAAQAKVPLILMNPVSNLRDCPPFKSEHRDGLRREELARWDSLVARAMAIHDEDPNQAITILEQAVTIDDQHAGLRFLLAKAYDAGGRLDEARREYRAAKELDICPLRILEPMNEAILDIARQTRTPLVDVRLAYEQLCPDGIPGDYWLIDHVHPSIAGHQFIADRLAEAMIRLNFLRPQPGWRERAKAAYREHVAGLDPLYFEKGMLRLEVLRRWSRGESTTEPLGRPPHEDWQVRKQRGTRAR